jgi:hypothetical protein
VEPNWIDTAKSPSHHLSHTEIGGDNPCSQHVFEKCLDKTRLSDEYEAFGVLALNLKTKFTLTISSLVFIVIVLVSTLYIKQLTKQLLQQSEDHASFVARQVFAACATALTDAAGRHEAPASSSPADLRDYANRSLGNSSSLKREMESVVGYSATIYVTISDPNGIALISSDAGLHGRNVAMRPAIASLVHNQGFFQELRTLYGSPQVYEYSLPVNLTTSHYADIRVGLSSALLHDAISPQLISASRAAIAVVALATLLAAFAVLKLYGRLPGEVVSRG